jgi:hypothetical protein
MMWCSLAYLRKKNSNIKTNTLAYWLTTWLKLGSMPLNGPLGNEAFEWSTWQWAWQWHGSVEFRPWREMWKTWAPPRCKLFVSLASLNHCWMTDRLSRRGLDHPECCPLWDQEEETVQHFLTSCVFVSSVWFSVLSIVGLQHLDLGLENYRMVVSCFTDGSQFISQGLQLFGCVSGIVDLDK